jgi:signal transduction histidine kinase
MKQIPQTTNISRTAEQCLREDIIPLFEKAITGDLSTYHNDNIPKCHEMLPCDKIQCSVYGNEPRRCWQIAGTYCGGKITGNFAEKYKTCKECAVFKRSTPTIVEEVGENLNNMLYLLRKQRQEIEKNYEHMKSLNEEIAWSWEHMHQSSKMTSLGTLAAGVAHEINNPLGFVYANIGNIEKFTNRLFNLIKIYEKVEPPPEIKLELENYLAEINYKHILRRIEPLFGKTKDGVNRIKKIVLDLRSFSSLEVSDVTEMDVNESVDATLMFLHHQYKDRIVISREYGEIPKVQCYAAKINQVFMNILANAYQAIEGTGEIIIKTFADNGGVIISITDNGKGIPSEAQDKIYEPFFTTKPVGSAMGMGLSLSYKIIKEHKGFIEAESEPGTGSTFHIRIPCLFDVGAVTVQPEELLLF